MIRSPKNVEWIWSPFSQLPLQDLYSILAARQQVFVVEQNCAYLDVDGFDPVCWHLQGRNQGTNGCRLLAYCRLIPPGARYSEASIGRVLTTVEGRGQGLGRRLMEEAIRQAELVYPGIPVRINAQQYLEGFYRSFGFETASEPYLEDGIVHIEMLRTAELLRSLR
ncbi:MAG: GNAT family N-acetyltransferase [Acidobacteriota bacterium]